MTNDKTQERLRENAGWMELEARAIGLANKVAEKTEKSLDDDNPEEVVGWIQALHGAVAVVQRMNPGPSGPMFQMMELPFPRDDDEAEAETDGDE